jgi:uncharacterized protein YndB with AHSA1/START domain
VNPKKPTPGKSLAEINPKLAKEWHPTKNGELTPKDVQPGSHSKVWWKCIKGEDHVWQATVKDRNAGRGCGICAGKIVVSSNSLFTLNPKLSKEWHPTKNSELTPQDIVPGSQKIVWWKCPKGDDHEWKTSVAKRSSGTNCPVCANQVIVPSNSLATLNPELAKQWHPTRNNKLTPYDVGTGSNKIVWWKCPKGDDHEWKTSVNHRNAGHGCGICANQVIVRSNSLATLNPQLTKEWHPFKNGSRSLAQHCESLHPKQHPGHFLGIHRFLQKPNER